MGPKGKRTERIQIKSNQRTKQIGTISTQGKKVLAMINTTINHHLYYATKKRITKKIKMRKRYTHKQEKNEHPIRKQGE